MHARNIQAGRHTFRVVYSFHEGRPELHVHLRGPNGSPAGIGPKGWPRLFRPLFPDYGHGRDRWSSMIALPVPFVSWRTGYRLRRFGGIRIHQAAYRLFNR